jgi:RNA polymerase sigma factor (sigma-70 family)
LEAEERRRFGELLLQHLDAAYNLARWLTRDDHAAEDVVQDAYCRALRYGDGFRGGDGRSWLLRVVRRSAYDWMQRHRVTAASTAFHEETHTRAEASFDPAEACLRQADVELLRESLQKLSLPFREVIVLRDLEGLSYQQMATVLGTPLGTVMSRLARARRQLQQHLGASMTRET